MTYYTAEDTLKQKMMLVEDSKGRVYGCKEGYAEKLERQGKVKRLEIEGTKKYEDIVRGQLQGQTNERNREYLKSLNN